jgi:hypothetical protein
MFEYSSITLNPESEITVDLLNQMVLNDSANERMRKIALEPPLAFALMDNNVGTPSDSPGANTSVKALYYAKNETTGITLNIDNVINSPLSVEVTVDRSGIYRFNVVAHMSSGASDCVPSFQITDIDADVVQEIGGFITSGTQDSTTGNLYTPSILFVDRWLYGGKTYRFTVTTGLLGTNSDIAFINGYKAPPIISYFWVQGYNGTGQQIELPDFQVPSFSIDIPDIDFNLPDFEFPNIEFPDFDFDFNVGGGFDGDFDFNPDFPFNEWSGYVETFDKGTGTGLGPVFSWYDQSYTGLSGAFGTVSNVAGGITATLDGGPVFRNISGGGGICLQGLPMEDLSHSFDVYGFVEYEMANVPTIGDITGAPGWIAVLDVGFTIDLTSLPSSGVTGTGDWVGGFATKGSSQQVGVSNFSGSASWSASSLIPAADGDIVRLEILRSGSFVQTQIAVNGTSLNFVNNYSLLNYTNYDGNFYVGLFSQTSAVAAFWTAGKLGVNTMTFGLSDGYTF